MFFFDGYREVPKLSTPFWRGVLNFMTLTRRRPCEVVLPKGVLLRHWPVHILNLAHFKSTQV